MEKARLPRQRSIYRTRRLDKNQVLVKDWAKNRGLLQALIEAGTRQPDRSDHPVGLRRGAGL